MLLAVPAILPAQSPPAFEAASIKLSQNPSPGGGVQITPGRFKGTDLALQWLILVSYRIKSGNLSGNLPRWTIDDRYTIDARTGDAAGEDRVLIALQNLLKERFHLAEHREMREQPVYFLTVAKGGAKMPAGSCVSVKKDYPNECWSQSSEGLTRTLDWRGTTVSDPSGPAYRTLAGQLSLILGKTVIDKTGLTGNFDVHLHWSSDPPPPKPGAEPPVLAMPDPTAPAVTDALEKQLGLRLEPGRGPVEYMVVDRVERPTEN